LKKSDSEPDKTLLSVRISRENKRMLKDVFTMALVFLVMALFFTTCYGIDILIGEFAKIDGG
jgi:hypothetical protein